MEPGRHHTGHGRATPGEGIRLMPFAQEREAHTQPLASGCFAGHSRPARAPLCEKPSQHRETRRHVLAECPSLRDTRQQARHKVPVIRRPGTRERVQLSPAQGTWSELAVGAVEVAHGMAIRHLELDQEFAGDHVAVLLVVRQFH